MIEILTYINNWFIQILFSAYLVYLLYKVFIGQQLRIKPLCVMVGTYIALASLRILSTALLLNETYKQTTGLPRFYAFDKSDYLWDELTEVFITLGYNVLIGLLVFGAFYLLMRATKGKLLDTSDAIFIGFAAMVTGWPNFLITLALLCLFVVLIKLVRIGLKKETVRDRIIITSGIPPAIIVMFFFGSILSEWTGLVVLR